jgi:hypothetical protein
MSDDRPLETLATLGQARAQLEIVLRAETHWRALGLATLPANRAAHERALAGNPVYQAWKLLVQAIGEMQTSTATSTAAGRGGAWPDGAPQQAPGRWPRIELRHVLERIRGETAFDSGGPGPDAPAAAAPSAAAGKSASPVARVITPPDLDIEEADVSFVVREPAAPALEPATPAEQAVAPLRAPPDASGTAADVSEEATETEVTIVPRRR